MDEWNNDNKETDLRQTDRHRGVGRRRREKKSTCETTNRSAYENKEKQNEKLD